MPRLALSVLCLFICQLASAAAPIDSDSPPFLTNVDALRANSDFSEKTAKTLQAPITTIVDKPKPSPTGDAHDYISYARYYWPDPAKPNGLPFIRHDGHSNEEQVRLGDPSRLGRFEDAVETLAVAWKVEGKPEYAQRAGDWLRAWFITPATRMYPNLEYAQIRLGHDGDHGTGTGVLDARGLTKVVDGLRLLRGSPALTSEETAAVKKWFSDYFKWLTTSKNGTAEHEAKNNHGSWYLVQAIAIARFLDDNEAARRLAEEDKARIAWQFQPDGSQPLELAREDGLGYSLFNLEAQFLVARLAEPLGVDVWHYQADNGASLEKGVTYLAPYDAAPQTWPHKQLKKLAPGFLHNILTQAAKVWPGAIAEPATKPKS